VLELVLEELIADPGSRPASTYRRRRRRSDWWSALAAMLRAHSGIAERIMVEITETAAIHDIRRDRGFVRGKDLGCRIAIDDFGAGYTSFRTCASSAWTWSKIDGAFVAEQRIRGDRPSCTR